MTVDFIYALYEVQSKTKFYIGRTIHPEQRIKEHRYGARVYKDGDELKYRYANALDSLGIEWDMEVLMECGPDTEFYEDYFVNFYRHEPLQNMKQGDSEPYMGKDYISPKDFVAAKELHQKQAKIKAVRALKPRAFSPLTRYIDDQVEECSAIQNIRARIAARKSCSV